MALLALIVLVWLGWSISTGRLKRPGSGQIGAVILALVGGAIAARGRPLVGGIMAAGGLLWLSRKPTAPKTDAGPAFVPDARMRESLDLLGLSPDADRTAVVEAHRRLIARNHPDAGGTEALARNINAARDYLLDHLPK